MEKIKKSEYKVYGAMVGFFAIIVLGFVFAIFPIIRGIVRDSDEIQKKRIDNEINQKGIDKIPEMKKLQTIVKEKKDSLEVLISAGGEVGFFKEIESLALKTGNKIEFQIENNETVSKKKKTETKDASIIGMLPHKKYVLMKITLLGNYENLIKFLNKLEKNEKYVNVVGLDISKMGIVDSSNSVFDSNKNFDSEVKQKEILQSIINLAVYIKE